MKNIRIKFFIMLIACFYSNKSFASEGPKQFDLYVVRALKLSREKISQNKIQMQRKKFNMKQKVSQQFNPYHSSQQFNPYQ